MRIDIKRLNYYAIFLVIASGLIPSQVEAQYFTKVTSIPPVNTGGDSWGVSWIDYDADGDLDLFTVASNSTSFFKKSMYENNGDGTFTEITSGPLGSDFELMGGGCSWADVDSDGDLDLFIANWDNLDNLLYLNDGGGDFTKVSTGTLVEDPGYSVSPAFADYDNDGDLDLFVANHISGVGMDDGYDYLYRNDGSTFSKVTGHLLTSMSAETNYASWADIDGDGDQDLFIANAWLNPGIILYRNTGGGSFEKVTEGDLPSDTDDMFGGSWGDYDNDGDLDLFVPSDPLNKLYANDGTGNFTRVTDQPMTVEGAGTWGSAWADIDNDGDLDLFAANTHYMVGRANYLYLNDGSGNFTKVWGEPVVTDICGSNGAAFGDFDADGDLDLYVTNGLNRNENNSFYENNGNSNSWIIIRCRGTVSNRFGVGTRVKVKATISGRDVWQLREISTQTGKCGQDSMDPHFGLGDASGVDSIIVEWPSGIKQVLTGVEPDRYLEIVEDTSTVATLLKSFLFTTVEDCVRIEWTVSEHAAASDFILLSQSGSGERILTVSETGRGDFEALDCVDSPGNGEMFLYTLSFRGEDGSWKEIMHQKYSLNKVQQAEGFTSIHPNPFNPRTTMTFRLMAASRVRIDIFDLSGRRVTTVVDQKYPSGDNSVLWDGKNALGREVSSGIYLARLSWGKISQTRKLILVR